MQKEMKRVRKDVPWLFKGGGKNSGNNLTVGRGRVGSGENGDTGAADDAGYVCGLLATGSPCGCFILCSRVHGRHNALLGEGR